MVLLIFLYSKLKLLLSFKWYSIWDPLLEFNKYFKFLLNINRYSKSLTDASGYLILVEFSGIFRLVESSKFFRCKVDINKNFSKFLRFWFKVKVVYYKVFLFIIEGGK